MAPKVDTSKSDKRINFLRGVGSIIDLGVEMPVSVGYPTRTDKVNDLTTTAARVGQWKISDLIEVDRATIAGGKILFEGNARPGSIAAIRHLKVKPGERILLRGRLTASGQLKDVIVVSGSRGVSALSRGQSILSSAQKSE